MNEDSEEWYQMVVTMANEVWSYTLYCATTCKTCGYAKWMDQDVECIVPECIMCPPVMDAVEKLNGRLEVALRESTFD